MKVPAGSQLFGCYTHDLLPTLLRREHLLESKYFTCACNRCADPTELGTHMSSLKCNKCDNGVVVSLDSLGEDMIYTYYAILWECDFGKEYWRNFYSIFFVFRSGESVEVHTLRILDEWAGSAEGDENHSGGDGPSRVLLRCRWS